MTMQQSPIAMFTGAVASTAIDPFYTYLALVDEFGEGQAFLLDAARDAESPYRMSLVAAVPVLEFQVKDGRVTVDAVEGLVDALRAELERLGYVELGIEARSLSRSYVDGGALCYRTEDPMALLEHIRSYIQQCRSTTQQPPFAAGLFGYIGYDAVHYLERLPKTTMDDRNLPDIRLQWFAATVHVGEEVEVYDSLAVLDRLCPAETYQKLSQRVSAVRQLVLKERRQRTPDAFTHSAELVSGEAVEDVPRDEYVRNVEKAKAYIAAGDIFQVVLSKRLRVPKRMHHYAVYDILRRMNPSPYMFMAEYPDMRLFGASPEVQFRVVNGVAEMKPIAGTSKGRGQSAEEDAKLVQRLLEDEKERAEHVMLVDLCRNDLGRVCRYGTVEVKKFMTVEAYSHLFHLVSTVQGRLRDDVSVFHALLATFPAGTLSGAPKIRAMEIIDELETHRRGPYGGMVGVVDFDGNANTAIVIRTIVEHAEWYYVQVGAGIVADSVPELEWQECSHKAGALLDVLGVRKN
ncbi:anthranilate synthase component I [Alicyclobacillus contaminans]|uniref:anthranilate synthase component I family protein n=1 Tax=Alicyclobacillus contaminans TaxID=392016 RepID=UPI0003FB63BA|nr:chorismate-binding protein [Alicyclobacillus contaminans]GMA49253.1 anthranilate synthase component I [Alicyclobacillus contaminans]